MPNLDIDLNGFYKKNKKQFYAAVGMLILGVASILFYFFSEEKAQMTFIILGPLYIILGINMYYQSKGRMLFHKIYVKSDADLLEIKTLWMKHALTWDSISTFERTSKALHIKLDKIPQRTIDFSLLEEDKFTEIAVLLKEHADKRKIPFIT